MKETFDGTTVPAGWEAWQGALTVVGGAALVVNNSTSCTLQSPTVPDKTTANQEFKAAALVEAGSDNSIGVKVTIKVRERLSPGGTVVKETSSAGVALKKGVPQTTGVTHVCKGAGNVLDVRVSYAGVKGSSFLVGEVAWTDLVTPPPTPDPDPGPVDPPALTSEQKPFWGQHPVYIEVPAGAKSDQYESQIIAYAKTRWQIQFDTGGESPNIWVAKASDPVYTLPNGQKIQCPTNAKQGTGSDYPAVVWDPVRKIEARMWQAKFDHTNRRITCNGLGIGSYDNVNPKAMGQAEIYGQNTGSGNSYTVGILRPRHFAGDGEIDVATRVACGFLRSVVFQWPATRTEGGSNAGYLTSSVGGIQMGARVYLALSDGQIAALADSAVALAAKEAGFTDPKWKTFFVKLLRGWRKYGFIPLDGTGSGINVYMEGALTADWVSAIGKPKSNGTYNFLGRALAAVFPWSYVKICDASVFSAYGR